MTKVKVLPVVEHDADQWGLPARLSVPVQRDRPIPVISSGRRIGEVAVDGTVKWTGPNAGANFREYGRISEALRQAARVRSQLRVAIIDGNVPAIVAPPERDRGK